MCKVSLSIDHFISANGGNARDALNVALARLELQENLNMCNSEHFETHKTVSANALMYRGGFVDPNRLDKGIYFKELPTIYELNTTIGHLLDYATLLKDPTGKLWLGDAYFENLKKCELVIIQILAP